jgi:pSer/pThr/pTyr-binding forkhead associated (FHA) protein
MLSPPISSSTHESSSHQPAISTRRRGLSYLRALSTNRSSSGNTPPATADSNARTSPRSYFNRASSYNDGQLLQSPSNPPRSSSRPNESTDAQAGATSTNNNSTRALSPTPETQRSQSQPRTTNSATLTEDQDMARHRVPQSTRRTTPSRNEAFIPTARHRGHTMTETSTATAQSASGAATGANATTEEKTEQGSKFPLPTIRFYPHHELGARRQSLQFTAVSRTLPDYSSIIRVGRYSDRDNVPATNPNAPSDAPVGFKSKVVSRKHCEFSYVDGTWQIKDVASSSGTFLNHIRLSQPNVESRLYPVKDGDIVQLGIDFRGGEEMIFRCVKIRLECNRPKHKRPNNFKYGFFPDSQYFC